MPNWKGTEMLTREKAIEEHRKMWRWLAEHPEKDKWDYLIGTDYVCNLTNNCFLCEYASEHSNFIITFCDSCPVDWGEHKMCTAKGDKGLYDSWNQYRCLGEFDTASEIARQIAELPERS